jgi:hypothetical protein
MSPLLAAYASSATAAIYGGCGDFRNPMNLRLLNKLTDAVFNADYYESADERRPNADTVLAAVGLLGDLNNQRADDAEIEPYFGEINLIWRAGRNKRVKATFKPNAKSYSVYSEEMRDRRAVEHNLRQNADINYLSDRLNWLTA